MSGLWWLLAASMFLNLVLAIVLAGAMSTLRTRSRAAQWITDAMEHIARLEAERKAMETWIRCANEDAGFHWWVPFESVWAACLAAYREKHYGKA